MFEDGESGIAAARAAVMAAVKVLWRRARLPELRSSESLTFLCFEPAHGLSMKKPFGLGTERRGNHAELRAGNASDDAGCRNARCCRAGQQHLLEGLDELPNRFGFRVSHTGDGLVVRRF